MNIKKNGFTLIELVAVLVILAMLTLIVIPLVLNIIRKAKISADRRSVDMYGKSIEISIAEYMLDNEKIPSNLDDLKVEYSGSKVTCKVKKLNDDLTIYLSECEVNNRKVSDIKNEDGWYHYGKEEKKSSDYKIGDEVVYNGINYYVIKPSPSSSDTVTLLKKDLLTTEEVNQYGSGYINKYTFDSQTEAFDYHGYGLIAYYSSDSCGYYKGMLNTISCETSYDKSDIKHVVDAWTLDNTNLEDLVSDSTGYSVRLISYEDLTENLGYNKNNTGTVNYRSSETPTWIFNINDDYNTPAYWTISPYEDLNLVWTVRYSELRASSVYVGNYFIVAKQGAVRPVITIKKSVLASK